MISPEISPTADTFDADKRNAYGSPYVEASLRDEEFTSQLGNYLVELETREQKEQAKIPVLGHSRLLKQLTFELKFYDVFTKQDGYINWWDVARDITKEIAEKEELELAPPPVEFDDARMHFCVTLDLEDQFFGVKPEEKKSAALFAA